MKKSITVLLTLIYTTIFSQTEVLNKIIPLSPNAAALAKYGEIPVSHFTGTANVSVPLYTIKTKEFNFPLELSYHTGGNKVEDVASWVGLGWSLGTIPSISRSVRGMPDEEGGIMDKFLGYTTEEYFSFDNSDLRKIRYLDALKEGIADSEPDVFYFTIFGKSGKFVYDQVSGKFVTLEESQIKITYANGFFTIIDENGYEYFFTDKDTSNGIATSWSVTSVSSPDHKEELLFEYAIEAQLLITLNPITKLQYLDGEDGDTSFITKKPIVNHNSIYASMLKKITFTEGVVEFTQNVAERLDLRGGRSLKNIKIKNLYGEEISSYDFEYKYITSSGCVVKDAYTNKWMLLDKVKNASLASRPLEHSFSYDELSFPPCRTSPAQDYWGYYNGVTSNSDLIPTVKHNSSFIYGADRKVDPDYSKFGILKKISYPTGGYTEFVFENNVMNITNLPGTTEKYIGGLRVKEIRSYADAAAAPIVKKYRYTVDYNSQVSSGEVFSDPHFVFDDIISVAAHASGGNNSGRYRRLQSYSNVQQVTFSGATVGYKTVIEETDAPTQSGISIYKYTHSKDEVSVQFPYPPPFSLELYRGKPLETSYYKKNGQQLILMEKKEFEYHPSLSYSKERYKKIFGIRVGQLNFAPSQPVMAGSFYATHVGASYRMATDANLLFSETTTTYFPGGNLVSIKEYDYNAPNHLLRTSQSVMNSNQEKQEVKYYYPQDPAMAGQPFVNELIAKNRLNTLLDTQTFAAGLKVSEELTTYDKSASTSSLLVPKSVFVNKGISAIDLSKHKKVTYDQYDEKGNILQYTPDNRISVCLIWGYNKTQPIAKIENITLDKIPTATISNLQTLSNSDNDHCTTATCKEQILREALNTFRKSLPGQMVTTYTYNPLVGVTSITDTKGLISYYEYDWYGRLKLVKDQDQNVLEKYCYNYKGQYIDCNDDASTNLTLYKSAAKSGSFTKSNCPAGMSGLPVVFYQEAGAAASTISQQDADNKGALKFNTDGQAFANATGQCVYLSIARSGSFTRNNCPAGIAGSTVSYSQAAGAEKSTISQADANAKGLAKFNADGQVYANTAGNCLYPNVLMSQLFTRNNCPSGIGEQLHYEVPAGTYTSPTSQAHANSLAQADIDANGQAYANTNGGCAPVKVYYNVHLYEMFTKMDCPSGVGEQVYYDVAPGTHTSTISQAHADSLAQDDINANGQEYANTYGGCAPN